MWKRNKDVSKFKTWAFGRSLEPWYSYVTLSSMWKVFPNLIVIVSDAVLNLLLQWQTSLIQRVIKLTWTGNVSLRFLNCSNTQTCMLTTYTRTHTHTWMLTVWVSVLPAALYHTFRERCCQLHLISVLLPAFVSLTHCLLPGAPNNLSPGKTQQAVLAPPLFTLSSLHLCRNVLHLNNRCLPAVLVGTYWHFPWDEGNANMFSSDWEYLGTLVAALCSLLG